MNKQQIRDICDERLAESRDKLITEHATPALMIGFGHDHHSGKVVILVPEGLDDLAPLAEVLRGAVAMLERGEGVVR